jgi:hypothetical protein
LPDKDRDYLIKKDLTHYREKFNLPMDPELQATIEKSKLNIDVFVVYQDHFKSLNQEN